MTSKEIRTICGYCHTNCGLIASVQDGKLVQLKADPGHPVNAGDACPKGIEAKYIVYAPDRLLYPLRKTGGGFKRITWDEALDEIAEKFGEIAQKYGGKTIVRGMGSPFTEENRDGFAQLLASLGSLNYFGTGYICYHPSRIAYDSVLGLRPQSDYKNSKCILLWGTNPFVSRRYSDVGEAFVGAYGRFHTILPDAKKRGAKLIVVDPWRNDVVSMADKWLQIEPGRDDALALSMLHVIIKEGLYDKDFVANWTTGFDELSRHVERYTPEWAEKITRIKAGAILEVARLYATIKPATLQTGNGMEQSANSVQTLRAIAMLPAITGNLDVEGGNVFFPTAKTTPLILKDVAAKLQPTKLSARSYPLFPQVPFPVIADAMLTGNPYQIRALIINHTNPVLTHADAKRTAEAFSKLDFMVVCENFMTATAHLADIILPETTPFERDGFRGYGGADGGFVAMRNKVVEPQGEARLALDIEFDIAKRMGVEGDFPWTNTREWMNHRLRYCQTTFEELKEKHIVYTTPPMKYRKYMEDGFNTPSKKIELYSKRFQALGYSPVPEFKETDTRYFGNPAMMESYPLVGTTRRSGYYTHTQLRNVPRLRRFEPEPLIRINPDDAGARKISDGDMVIAESTQGLIKIKAKVTDETGKGIIIVDFGWGNPSDGGPNVNELTYSEERDPIAGSTSTHRFRCQVKKA